MSKKSTKSKSEPKAKERGFFYPKIGVSGVNIKATSKEEADKKAAALMAEQHKDPDKHEGGDKPVDKTKAPE